MVVKDLRPSHAQRGEDIFLVEVAQALASHALHHLGKKEKAGVAVIPFLSGCEVERLLSDDQIQSVLVSGQVLLRNASKVKKAGITAHAAGVRHKVMHGDALPVITDFREKLANIVLHGKPALLLQKQN